ncbi:MAG: cupredoxin domain-containing protein [Rhodocyclaceae bacterium]|nr:cupredoxin domain-containing protein [Rhodocyclaceae bacterium]
MYRTVFLLCLLLPGLSSAADNEYALVIQGNRFIPDELVVPAGKKLKLVVENRDDAPEEFESYSLNREKIVPAHSSIILYVGPLNPGAHDFFGDYHESTARGRLIAR